MVYSIRRMFLLANVLAMSVFGAVFVFRRLLLEPADSFRSYVLVLRAASLYFCLLWLNYIECIRTHDSISASDSKFTIAIVLSTRIYYRGIQILANLQHFGWYLALAAHAQKQLFISFLWKLRHIAGFSVDILTIKGCLQYFSLYRRRIYAIFLFPIYFNILIFKVCHTMNCIRWIFAPSFKFIRQSVR